MLGKTAAHIFWMFRYLERCENTARLINASHFISLTQKQNIANHWDSILNVAGNKKTFLSKYGAINKSAVINFILRDKTNPSSVLSSIENARQNARIVRNNLTKELFETINETYLKLSEIFKRPINEKNLLNTLATIRTKCQLTRGTLHGTMLRDDTYIFARMGSFIERADNTSRILDMKYYVLLPSAGFVGSTVDNAQWENILRSVSAYRSYNWLNEYEFNPSGICKYLILDERLPRSLIFCNLNIYENLMAISKFYNKNFKSLNNSEKFYEEMLNLTIEKVFEEGLHEFLVRYLKNLFILATIIETDFRFYK